LQSPPRALQERLTLTRDALAHARARKPFGMRSYEKCARNPFGIRSYKIIGLKVPWNQHLQKRVGHPCRQGCRRYEKFPPSFSPFASYRLPSASPRFNGVDNRGVSPSLVIPRPDVFCRTQESLREIPRPPRSARDDGPEKNGLPLASHSFYAVGPRVRRYQLVEDFVHAGNGWRAICKRRRLSPHARGGAKTPSRAAGRHPPQ